MYSRHHIEQVVFDLETENKQGALQLQERVSNLFHRQVTAILNRLLTEMELEGQHIRIEKLVLDTGLIHSDKLEEDLPGRIELALREALEKLLHSYRQNSTTDNFEVIYTGAFYLNVFRSYLESGTLGNVLHHTEISPETILLNLLKTDTASVIRLIRETGKKDAVRRRLAWHLEEPAVISVIRSLEPANASLILNYVNDFDQLKQQEELIRTETEEFKRAKYFFVLSYLILERGSIFNTREFVRSLLKQMAGHYNLNYRALLLTFMEHIDEFILQEQSTSLPTLIKDVFIQDFPAGTYLSDGNESIQTESDSLKRSTNNGTEKVKNERQSNIGRDNDTGLNTEQTSAVFLSDEESRKSLFDAEVPYVSEIFSGSRSTVYKSSFLYLLREGYLPETLQHISLQQLTEWLNKVLKSAQRNSLIAYLRYKATPNAIERLHLFFPSQSIELMEVSSPATRHRREQITEGVVKILKRIPMRLSSLWMGKTEVLVRAKAAAIFWKQRQGIFSETLFLQHVITGIASESNLSGSELLQQFKKAVAPDHYLYTKLKEIQLPDSVQVNDTKENSSGVSLTDKTKDEQEYFRKITEAVFNNQSSENTTEEWGEEQYRSILVHYLRYGDMPWWAANYNVKKLPETIRLLFHPSRFKATLRSVQQYIDEPPVAERLLALIAYRLPRFEEMIRLPLPHQIRAEHWAVLMRRLPETDYRLLQHFRIWSSIKGYTVADREWLSHPFFEQLLKRPVYLRAKCISTFSVLRSEAPQVFYHPFIQQLIHVLWFVLQWERIKAVIKSDLKAPDYYLDMFLRQSAAMPDVETLSDSFLWDQLRTPGGFMALSLLGRDAIEEAKQFYQKRVVNEDGEQEGEIKTNQLTDAPFLNEKQQTEMSVSNQLSNIDREVTDNKESTEDTQEKVAEQYSERLKGTDTQKTSETKKAILDPTEMEAVPVLASYSDRQQMKAWDYAESPLPDTTSDEMRLINETDEEVERQREAFVKELLKITPDEFSTNRAIGTKTETILTTPALRMEVHRDTFRDVLMEFLTTGHLPSNPICSFKQLPERVIAYLMLLDVNGAEHRQILSLLKNKTIRMRFFTLYERQVFMVPLFRALFRNNWRPIEPLYLDVWQLTLQRNAVFGHVDLLTLNQITFLFFIQETKTGAKAYVQFILQQIFTSTFQQKRFIVRLKSLLVSGKLVLRSNLPLLLLRIMQPITMDRKDRERKEKIPLPGDEVPPALPVKDSLLIDNAGLVLLWPFFTYYFQTLDLTKENRFVSLDASYRAVYLLDYLVYGNEEGKELNMTLNKLLCAVPRQIPLGLRKPITEKEAALTIQLLETAISRWSVIGNTSIEGLRESFLKRRGKLEWIEEKVILTVEPKAFDMLIDKLPWSISTVRLPWLEKNIIVKWRN